MDTPQGPGDSGHDVARAGEPRAGRTGSSLPAGDRLESLEEAVDVVRGVEGAGADAQRAAGIGPEGPVEVLGLLESRAGEEVISLDQLPGDLLRVSPLGRDQRQDPDVPLGRPSP